MYDVPSTGATSISLARNLRRRCCGCWVWLLPVLVWLDEAVVLFWLSLPPPSSPPPGIGTVDVLGKNDSAIESLECLLMTREERRVEIAAEAEAAAEVMLRSRMMRLVMTSMLASWPTIDDDDDDDDVVLVDTGREEVVDKGGGTGVVTVAVAVVPVDVADAATTAEVVLIAVVLLADDAAVDPGG